MLPTLTALSGSSDTSVAEVRQRVAAAEGLTPEEVQELLPSGRQPVFTNRVSWAIIHMERSASVRPIVVLFRHSWRSQNHNQHVLEPTISIDRRAYPKASLSV